MYLPVSKDAFECVDCEIRSDSPVVCIVLQLVKSYGAACRDAVWDAHTTFSEFIPQRELDLAWRIGRAKDTAKG